MSKQKHEQSLKLGKYTLKNSKCFTLKKRSHRLTMRLTLLGKSIAPSLNSVTLTVVNSQSTASLHNKLKPLSDLQTTFNAFTITIKPSRSASRIYQVKLHKSALKKNRIKDTRQQLKSFLFDHKCDSLNQETIIDKDDLSLAQIEQANAFIDSTLGYRLTENRVGKRNTNYSPGASGAGCVR
jgi:hypothetical protein